MTWKDLKILCLQKVFAISDGKLVEDDTTREYLTALPGAANEALQLLAAAGRFIKKSIIIEREEPASGIVKYDLKKLAEDFYSLDADGIYFDGAGGYGRPADWTMEAGHVLVFPASRAGTWTIWYNAYPPELTAETTDNYELPVYPEVAVLLPLYIASQVYKDDDVGLAAQYRNEFEVGRDALVRAAQRGRMGRDSWHSVTGWF